MLKNIFRYILGTFNTPSRDGSKPFGCCFLEEKILNDNNYKQNDLSKKTNVLFAEIEKMSSNVDKLEIKLRQNDITEEKNDEMPENAFTNLDCVDKDDKKTNSYIEITDNDKMKKRIESILGKVLFRGFWFIVGYLLCEYFS